MYMERSEIGQSVRCAIYTRKSEHLGLEMEFNSLESQRFICSAYISSQRPKGWLELTKQYDDGGKTGGNLDRPALQELLSDVESGFVDVVVVYKLDRISRNLLNFVRLMDVFEQFGVGFVAVTQNFDTAESTGRLILNILLTFAQFEREIVSDRLRDKFGAMKQRGMFIGGHPAYGYDLVDKKLVPNRAEARVVRWMFQRYLEVKSYCKIARELKEKDVVRRSRISKRGHQIQGRGFSNSSVWNMLNNRLYIGEVQSHGQFFPGQHKGIVGRDLWDEVQSLRAKRTRAKVVSVHKTDLLRDLMHDSYGRTMGPYRDYRFSEVRRYYISNQSEWGRRHNVRRLRTKAEPLEQMVVAAIAAMLADRARVRAMLLRLGIFDSSLNKLSAAGELAAKHLERSSIRQAQCALRALIERIELSDTLIKIVIRSPELPKFLAWDGVGFFRGERDKWSRPHVTDVIDIPSDSIRMRRELTLLLKQSAEVSGRTPNPGLVGMLRRAHLAQEALYERSATGANKLAAKIQCCPKRFTRLVRLNYLAPDIVASILAGTQPPTLNSRTLWSADLPMDWTVQRRLFGFPDQPDYLKGAPGW